jgi:hypothetical protein
LRPEFLPQSWNNGIGNRPFDTGVFADLRQLFKVDKKWNIPGVLI